MPAGIAWAIVIANFLLTSLDSEVTALSNRIECKNLLLKPSSIGSIGSVGSRLHERR
jgi:hypothetical protein